MKQTFFRWVFYLTGMITLAVGLTLNTKTGLGVSAIMSVPFALSEIWHLNLGNVTLMVYMVFIVVEMLLHAHMAKKQGGRLPLRRLLLMDALQLPVCLAFTRVINLVSRLIPVFSEAYPQEFAGSLPGRFLFSLIAVALTGIGAAMTLNMRMVPSPADGMIQVLSDASGKPLGFAKNCFDLFNVCVNIILSMAFSGGIVGVGPGTIVAALGVGRVIALFNHLAKKPMCRLSGL